MILIQSTGVCLVRRLILCLSQLCLGLVVVKE